MGDNSYGQLGDGTTENRLVPVKVLDNVVAVSLGGFHTGAITADGSLYMWGSNSWGQVGDGTTQKQLKPVKVLDNVVSVSLGERHSGAITEDGSLYMWGEGNTGWIEDEATNSGHITYTPIKVLDDVVEVSLKGYHSGAITEDGSLYMWGKNYYGQIGNGTTETQEVPIKIMENIESVSLGFYYSGAITTDGSLYMWGRNSAGELGNGGTEKQLTPMKVMDDIVFASLKYSSGAITTDGSLYMWGDNVSGQIGNGCLTDQLIPVKIMDDVVYVETDAGTTAAISHDGNLYMWGDNYEGRIGDGYSERNQTTPVKVLENIKSVILSTYVSGAITKDGSLYMWGSNECNQVGNGVIATQAMPLKIFEYTSPTAELIQEIESAEEGSIVKTELGGNAILLQEVLEAMQGKDITLNVILGNGITWSMNGTDLTSEELSDMDLAVEKTEDGNISADDITSLAGDRATEQFVFAENGTLALPMQFVTTVPTDIVKEKAVFIQCIDDTFKLADTALVLDGAITFDVKEKADSIVVYGTNGDTNGDNSVTIKDTMQMLHHISGRTSLNEVGTGFADVDMNNTVNLQDLMREMRYVSGRTDTLYETE